MENKNMEKNKSGKELKHVDTFFSFSVSFDRDQKNNYLYFLCSVSLIEVKGTSIYMLCVNTYLVFSALSLSRSVFKLLYSLSPRFLLFMLSSFHFTLFSLSLGFTSIYILMINKLRINFS